MCVMCEKYPCENFTEFFKNYSVLKSDNALYLEKGADEWAKMQDLRVNAKFSYTDKSMQLKLDEK